MLEKLCLEAVSEGVFPGAAYAVVTPDRVIQGCVGRHTYCPESPLVTAQTLWDLASLTKVVATTTLAMRLELDLDAPVQKFLPGLVGSGKGEVTVKHLLTHTSGLPAFKPYHLTTKTAEEARLAILCEPLVHPIGTTLYSDLSMILVGWILEKLRGKTLDQLVTDLVFRPLAMSDTTFNPTDRARCPPTETTEPWRNSPEPFVQGVVHDPTAFRLGGVSGHAGLFSTLEDLIKFAQALLNELGSPKLSLYTRRANPESTRALGWDTRAETGSSAGSRFSMESFGHTGFTGTSIWVDPKVRIAGILLTNRVHPTADNARIVSFRPRFYDQAWGLSQPVA